MTRDGAVEENLANKSKERVSKRLEDTIFDKVPLDEKAGTPKIKREDKAQNLSRKRGRLRFTSEDAVAEKGRSIKDKKSSIGNNQKQGKDNGTTKRSQKKATTKKRIYQEEKKKKVSKIHMEEVAYNARQVIGKTQDTDKYEDDNAAIKGVQAGEHTVLKSYQLYKRRSALKSKQNYEKSPKLKEKKPSSFYGTRSAKAGGEVAKENGKLQKFWQKQQIKRQYAKAKSAENAATSVAQKLLAFFKGKGKKVVSFFAKPRFIITMVGLLLIFALVAGGLTTCSMSSMQVMNTVMLSSYIAEPENIEKAELYYTELEAALQIRINQLESEYPGLDEYRYNIGEISHDPHTLISYLTAKYEAFTFEQVKGEIETLFAEQYGINIEQVIETREETRTVQVGESLGNVVTSAYCSCVICCGVWSGGPTASGVMPKSNHTIAVDANSPFLPMGTKVVMNGVEYTVEDTGNFARYGVTFDVYFDSHIEALTHGHRTWEVFLAEGNTNTVEVTTTKTLEVLNVTMSAKPLRSVIIHRMNEDEKELYELIYSTKGNLQAYKMPIDLNWYSYVKRPYGYSINPSSGQRELHRGVEIALQEGTQIQAGKAGVIVTVGNTSNYGNYIVLEDNNGYRLTYAHLSSAAVTRGQEVVAGDVIGMSGSTGSVSGGQLYLELVKNDVYYNPIFYVGASNSSYGGSGIHYDDETVQALMSEAEKYLGMPYVWGGSSPSTSFDCSGFVSYVFTNSGVYNMGRQTAQGIYNLCDPIDPSEARAGDIIFFTGTYNAGVPVSHVGIYAGDGQMIHCGNPIQYTSIYSPYWQQHFYSFGRLR